jgi:hypothetical protein
MTSALYLALDSASKKHQCSSLKPISIANCIAEKMLLVWQDVNDVNHGMFRLWGLFNGRHYGVFKSKDISRG